MEDLIKRITAAKRPGAWHEVAGRRFYVETLTALGFQRHRSAASRTRVEHGELTTELNGTDLAVAIVLDAVTDWEAVTGADFPAVAMSESERAQALPFAHALLRAWIENRPEAVLALFAIARQAMEAAAQATEEERGNSTAS